MSSSELEASVAARLGGRWAISWLGFVITAPIALLVLVLTAQNAEDVPAWLLIGVCAVGLGGAWSFLLHRTAFRDRDVEPVPLLWVLGASAATALVFVAVSVSLGALLGVLNDDASVIRFPVLFVVIALWGPLLTLTLDSQWRYRVQRDELIQQEVQQQLANAQEIELLKNVRESVLADVESQVKASNQTLINEIDRLMQAGQVDADQVARDLRVVAESSVRPLSHQLEERSRSAHRTPGFFSGLGNVVRYQPFRPLAVSIIYAITTTPREVVEKGVPIALSLLAVTVAFLFALMMGFNGAMRRWPARHSGIFIAGLVVIQIPTVLFSPLRQEFTGKAETVADLVSSVVIGTMIVFATSAFGAWNRTRREVIADFRRDVDEETLATLARGGALAKATREAAIILHGSVQTQLHSCALSIEEATRNGDLTEVNRALVHARALLEKPELSRGEDGVTSLGSAIDERIAQWRGLLAVSVFIDPGARELTGVVAGHLADVVEEGIANALHHGSATEVSVRIELDNNELLVSVRDNGSGPVRGAPGLGSRLFSRLSGRWELDARTDGAQGSVLTICLPASHAAESFFR